MSIQKIIEDAGACFVGVNADGDYFINGKKVDDILQELTIKEDE